MAELHQLSTAPSAECQLDVVFVHGLGGNWQGTWGNGAEEGNSWPHWLEAESPDAPERRRVVEQTRGVMFVATPHQGSSLATLATAIQFTLPSVRVRDLRANDAYLNALFLWSRNFAPRHNILTRSYV